MPSMDTNKRYDLFISFHGGETLPGKDFTTRDLARATHDLVGEVTQKQGREPSIFFDENPLHLNEELSQIFRAVLQTRGGGLAVFLLTSTYFKRDWCVAELGALLHIYRTSRDTSAAINVRFFCLEEVNNVRYDPYFLHLFEEVGRMPLLRVEVTTLRETSFHLEEKIRQAWDRAEPSRPTILGGDRDASMAALQRFFSEDDLAAFRTVLKQRNISSVSDAFMVAETLGKFGPDDLDGLETVIRRGSNLGRQQKRDAVAAYRRKWLGTESWDWDELLGELEEVRQQKESKLQEARQLYPTP